MKKLILTAIFTLTGCATVSKTYAPDGSEGFSINCSGAALSWDACYSKAGDQCGSKGYIVLAKDGDQVSAMSGNQFGLYTSQSQTRSMLIKCK